MPRALFVLVAMQQYLRRGHGYNPLIKSHTQKIIFEKKNDLKFTDLTKLSYLIQILLVFTHDVYMMFIFCLAFFTEEPILANARSVLHD